jgi:hypothetical protein
LVKIGRRPRDGRLMSRKTERPDLQDRLSSDRSQNNRFA